MDEPPEPERIEIELTPSAERHDGWRHQRGHDHEPEPEPDEVVVTGSSEGGAERSATDRRRLIATAAGVGVVALLLGWSIGRSGGSDQVASSNATTTVAAADTTEAVVETVLPGEALPSPTTTRPRRTTTTTTIAPPTIESVELDPRLAGIDLTLVGLTEAGGMIELDLAAQTLARREIGLRSFEPNSLIVGDGWLAVGDFASASPLTLVIHDDGTSERVNLGEPWQPLWRVGTDRFWRPIDDSDWFPPLLYEEVDLSGQPTGATLQLPPGSWTWRVDPAGGVIVNTAGKIYTVDESSVDYVGSGDLLGLSATTAVTRDCDDRLRCGLFVTDRLSGEIRQVPIDESLSQALALTALTALYRIGGSSFGAIAPDGSMSVILVPPPEDSTQSEPSAGLVDLESGDVIRLGAPQNPSALVWTADSRFAFYLNDSSGFGRQQLVAFDRGSGEHFEVLPADDTWTALSSRPSDP